MAARRGGTILADPPEAVRTRRSGLPAPTAFAARRTIPRASTSRSRATGRPPMATPKPKRRKPAWGAKPKAFKPRKLTAKKRRLDNEPEDGPRGWFLEQIESTYSRLAPPGAATAAAPSKTPASGVAFA